METIGTRTRSHVTLYVHCLSCFKLCFVAILIKSKALLLVKTYFFITVVFQHATTVYSFIMNNLDTTSKFCGRYKRSTLDMICSLAMGFRIPCVVRILSRSQLPVKRVPGNVDILYSFTVH
jgi:hypothetical protein